MKQNEHNSSCGGDACQDQAEISNGKSAALEELEEKERLSIAMSSYYLLYR